MIESIDLLEIMRIKRGLSNYRSRLNQHIYIFL